MGRSVFICKVPDHTTMKKAIEAVLRHNDSEMKPLGRIYTTLEFEQLDPMRAAVISGLSAGPGLTDKECEHSCMEAWTRGEDIDKVGCLVWFQGSLWLEVENFGGGACTTMWLKQAYPEMGWIGTEGKPYGFKQTPAIAEDTLLQLLSNFELKIV